MTQKGVVKGVSKGTATITATSKDGSGKKVKCKVTVKSAITKAVPNVTDKVLNMKVADAAKYLGLSKKVNDYYTDYTFYYVRKGKTLSDGSSSIEYYKGWENQKGMWNLIVRDKTISFQGIKVGMGASQVKKILKKNGWVFVADESDSETLYFNKKPYSDNYLFFYVGLEKGKVDIIDYCMDAD